MTKFNEEITKTIIYLHSNGIPIKYCAKTVGISRKTVYNWINKGKKAKSGKYYIFYKDMMKARGLFILYHVKKINESDDWRSSQYILQLENPEHYIIKNKLNVENKQESYLTAFDEDLFNKLLEK